MKKLVYILLVLVLLVPIIAGCTPEKPAAEEPAAEEAAAEEPAAEEPAERNLAQEIFGDVEPLETPAHLTFGILSDSQHGFPQWFFDAIGGYAMVGITADFAMFGNGPVMVEAVPANGWDAGTYGLGGTLAGKIGHNVVSLGAATYDNAIFIFGAKDSDVVKAGTIVDGYPTLYGSAETWKGKDVFLPTGTTAQYVLAKGLEKFGLTTEDVTLTHMDVPSVNTALLAGQGDFGALWSNFVFKKDILENYIPVMRAKDVDAAMITTYNANPNSWADPVKKAAIIKWVEMYTRFADWIYDDNGNLIEENVRPTLEYYIEWNESNGIKSDYDELRQMIDLTNWVSIEEQYELFNKKVDTEFGVIDGISSIDYEVLKFFIADGKYPPEAAETFVQRPHNPEAIFEIYENRWNH